MLFYINKKNCIFVYPQEQTQSERSEYFFMGSAGFSGKSNDEYPSQPIAHRFSFSLFYTGIIKKCQRFTLIRINISTRVSKYSILFKPIFASSLTLTESDLTYK